MKIQQINRQIMEGIQPSIKGLAKKSCQDFDKIMLNASPKPGKVKQNIVNLGTITKDLPTVSHLLSRSSLKDQCWKIIHDPVNSNKSFRSLRTGTQICYDPSSGELLWGKSLKKKLNEPIYNSNNSKTSLSKLDTSPMRGMPDSLSHAVKKFIGKDYQDMNCYEMVVGGLQDMGIQYYGKGGLGQHLISQAKQKGLPENHYLNGEGLIASSGKPIFTKNIHKITDPKNQAKELMKELLPILEQGQILSFSTPRNGHTGVVSKSKGQWTFINSGTMDNNLYGTKNTKQVGEENLFAELKSWCKRIAKSGSNLKVTLGKIDSEQLSFLRTGKNLNHKA